jgi:hypothetical protein
MSCFSNQWRRTPRSDDIQRLNRSSSDKCEGNGDENQSLFSWLYSSLTVSACPGLRRVSCDKNHGMLVSDEGAPELLKHTRWLPRR